MAVTKEQILAAADQIAAEGLRPTLEAVRQITGGSYTTISPVLNEWKAKQASAAAPIREPAPQAITEKLAELGSDLWAVALEMANNRLAAEREALDKARADLEADRAEATELADRLAGQVDELQSRLASIEAAEAAARGEADTLRDQLAAAQEQAHTADARAQEIERRAAELRTELDRAHQEVNQARQTLAEQQKAAKATADQLTAELEKARQSAAAAREQAAGLAGQLEAITAQNKELMAAIAPRKRTTAKKDADQGEG